MKAKNKLVCGIGINDYDGSMRINGKRMLSYACWHSMLNRCYSAEYQTRFPTYIGCSVCEEWLLFSNFKVWYDENYKPRFQLDKDILFPGNKVYSPETCRFVPQYLNSLLTDRGAARGEYPLGVMALKPGSIQGLINTSYQAQCNNGYGKQIRKTFKTIEEAQHFYSITKKRVVKEQAIRAFLDNAIKTDVYLALVRREY